MSREFDIALAQERDAAAIARMSRELIEHGLGWSWREARVLRCICSPDTNVPVIRAGGRIAAFAIMHYRDTEADLLLFAVAPECRRQGMASALIEWLLTTARVAGVEQIRLEVRAGNRPGRAFYENAGFTIVARLPEYYQGRESAMRMVLKVAAPVG
ncbi:MAG: GNAT family N-acetyltransferase [Gammaproteobacteria bacterium]|nr:GNAT family N-acetyltransferase [Gammaproteobacteria bacterium]